MSLVLTPLTPAFAEVAAALHAMSGLAQTWDANAFAQLLTLGGAAGLIAILDDMPVGLVLWHVAADEAEILTVAVSPLYRRLGIGRDLLHDALSQMRSREVATVFLEVAVDNAPARALYRALGFGQQGRRVGYYQSHGVAHDALILAKKLIPSC